mmetsp:Transcript_12940/g.34370  ORF Transcript_12940/g.34370 Transcript_12940/m.34370 type:complete len:210 (+) Transcript_12940:927-1556(+)
MRGMPAASASWNWSLMLRGSAIPVASMTMWSYLYPFIELTAANSANVVKSSSAMEQQTHPSPISTNSAAPCIFWLLFSSKSSLRAVIFASMLTAAMSLTTTPTLESLSCEASSSRFLNSVVLPVPRKPLRSVTGTLAPGSATVDDNGRSRPNLRGACSARTLATLQARRSMALLVQRICVSTRLDASRSARFCTARGSSRLVSVLPQTA